MKKKKKNESKLSLQWRPLLEANKSDYLGNISSEPCFDKEQISKLFVLLSSGNADDAAYVIESEG